MPRFPKRYRGKRTKQAWLALQNANLRRMARRGIMRGALTRTVKQPVQYFVRTQYQPGFYALAAGAGAVGASRQFNLSQLVNSTEFTNLYDQYQIKGIKISLIPRFTEALSTGTSQTIGNMWSVLDYDDATTPTSLDQLLQYQNIKRTRTNMIHSRYLKPAVAREVFNTGIATAYSPQKNVWLDCTSNTVEHYGIKFWFDSTPAGVTFDVQVKFYLAFKNVR